MVRDKIFVVERECGDSEDSPYSCEVVGVFTERGAAQKFCELCNDEVGESQFSYNPFVPNVHVGLTDPSLKVWAARLNKDGKVTGIKTTTTARLFLDHEDQEGTRCMAIAAATIAEASEKAEERFRAKEGQ